MNALWRVLQVLAWTVWALMLLLFGAAAVISGEWGRFAPMALAWLMLPAMFWFWYRVALLLARYGR